MGRLFYEPAVFAVFDEFIYGVTFHALEADNGDGCQLLGDEET